MQHMTSHDNSVNDDIERRLEEVEDSDVRAFLTKVVGYERDNLHLQEPRYTDEYRTFAENHIDTDDTTEDQ